MCKLIENPQLVEAMSKNNIAKGSEMFSCDAVTNKWESVIKMVIN
jgi:glycosyltransferase involved in cell wall biosynthesis